MRSFKKTLILLMLASPMMAAATCGTTSVDGEVQTDTVTTDNETKQINDKACKEGSRAIPYTTGMPGSKLANFFGTLSTSDLVMVEYRCDRFMILDECAPMDGTTGGGYGFTQVPLVEETRSFKGSDEIKGNFRHIAVSGSASASQSVAMDLKLRTIGQMTTTVNRVYRESLHPESCGNATHFIKKAQVGAFQLDTSSARGVDLSVNVVAAGGAEVSSEQARESGLAAGDWEACKKTGNDNLNCRVPVQVTLVPILPGKPKPGELAPPVPTNPCPLPGQVVAGGKCTSPQDAVAAGGGYICDPTDKKECETQCRTHKNLTSCAYLAEFFLRGDADTIKDEIEAQKLLQDACRGKDKDYSAPACTRLGQLFASGDAVKKSDREAFKAFNRACEGGDGAGCYELGVAFFEGSGTNENLDKARETFQRACDAGMPDGCARIGAVLLQDYRMGNLDMDAREFEKEVVGLFRKACFGDSPEGCFFLGLLFESGEGISRPDPLKANAYFQWACDNNNAPACLKRGELFRRGRVVETVRSPREAMSRYRMACYGDDQAHGTDFPIEKMQNIDGCAELGRLHAEGLLIGVAEGGPDAQQTLGRDLLTKSCQGNSPRGCYYLGMAQADGRYGVEINEDASLETLLKACLAEETGGNGDGDACYEIGSKIMDMDPSELFDEGDSDNPAAAKEELVGLVFQMSCELDPTANPRGCAKHYLIEHQKENIDQINTMRRLKYICIQQGYTEACANGGFLIMEPLLDAIFGGEEKKSIELPDEAAAIIEADVRPMLDAGCSHITQEPRYVWYDPADAREHALISCYLGAILFDKGIGVSLLPIEALRRYRSLCNDHRFAAACKEVAHRYETDKGLGNDLIKAMEYYEKACGADVDDDDDWNADAKKEACERMEDVPFLFKTFKQMCDRKNFNLEKQLEACSGVAQLYAEGLEGFIKVSDRDAAKYYQRACEVGHLESCTEHARRMLRRPSQKTSGQIVELLEKACEGDDMNPRSMAACAQLGQIYFTGLPARSARPYVTKDYNKAGDLLDASCRSEGLGCSELGVIYELGYGRPSDYTVAASAYDLGCTNGTGEACHRLASLLEQGFVPEIGRNLAGAAEYYRKACELKHRPACARAQRLERKLKNEGGDEGGDDEDDEE